MPNIKPISDLRNYAGVLHECSEGNPVFLTKNGRGKYIVMDIRDYEEQQAELKLYTELMKAKDSSNYYTLFEAKKRLGLE